MKTKEELSYQVHRSAKAIFTVKEYGCNKGESLAFIRDIKSFQDCVKALRLKVSLTNKVVLNKAEGEE